jgi:hypothetical protein
MSDSSPVRHDILEPENVQALLSSSEGFEAKWKAFQQRFDEAIAKSLGNLAVALGAGGPRSDAAKLTPEERRAVFGGQLPSLDLIGRGLGSGKYKNVVVCAGAGLSTSAGPPHLLHAPC